MMLVLALQRKGMRYLEAFMIAMTVLVGACFAVQLWWARRRRSL